MAGDREAYEVHRHAENSALREVILEHLFIGEVQRHLWRLGIHDVEVLRSEFDAAGYDLVVSRGEVTRHIQLKAARESGARRFVNVNRKLAAKPAGCVIWILIDDELNAVRYLWFGNGPSERLPNLEAFGPSHHTKANMDREKTERPGLCEVPKSAFRTVADVPELVRLLLGVVSAEAQELR